MARVTLSSVAERAGVSLATASKVMNGRADVKDSTRSAVQQVARELGYAPKRREPTDGSSVVIAFDALNNPYSIEILHGATLAARRAGVDLVVTTMESPNGDDPRALTKPWFREMADRGHGAVISVTAPVTAKQLAWSRDCSLPLLVIDPITSEDDAPLEGLVRIVLDELGRWPRGHPASAGPGASPDRHRAGHRVLRPGPGTAGRLSQCAGAGRDRLRPRPGGRCPVHLR